MTCNRPGYVERDWAAADRIVELREGRGLSRDALGHAISIRASKDGVAYPVSGRTIHRVEKLGAIPTARVKFAIADFFGCDVKDIWDVRNRVEVRAS